MAITRLLEECYNPVAVALERIDPMTLSSSLITTAAFYLDVVWPALVLEQQLLSVVPIGLGLIVEWLALWQGGFGLACKRAALASMTMNAFSTLLGILLVPIAGIGWDVLLGSLVYSILGTPGMWVTTGIVAVLLNTVIEAGVLYLGFKVCLDRRRVGILGAANCASVAIALLLRPPSL